MKERRGMFIEDLKLTVEDARNKGAKLNLDESQLI